MKSALSLKQSWTALILFAVIVPVLTVMAWYGNRLYDEQLNNSLLIERQANEQLRDQIGSEVKRLNTLLINKSDPLSFLVNKTVTPEVLKKINALLELIVEREPAIHGVMLLSRQADIIAVIDHEMGLKGDKIISAEEKRSAAEHWDFAINTEPPEIVIPSLGRTYISSPKHHKDGVIFKMAIPVGQPAKAILIAEFEVEKLWPADDSQGHGIEALMRDYMLDRRGSLVTVINDSAYKPGDIMTHLAIARTALAEEEWTTESSYVGVINQPVFGTLTIIPTLNWALVSEVIVSEITRPILEQLLKLFIFTLSGLAVFIWLALRLASKTIKPIQTICEAIDFAAKGNYQFVPTPSGIHELNDLTISFNSMIKARQSAENSLREREQDLAITLNSIGDAVITTDANSHVTRMNPVAEQLTGWSLQEAQGQPVKTIFPIINASTREPIENPVDKVIATGEIIHLSDHTTLIAKDGTEHQIADSAAPIRNMEDDIMGMVLVFNDVSEQYKLRKKAKKARQQMQNLLDDMQTMVAVLELDGIVNFINTSPLKIAGLVPDDVLNRKLWKSNLFSYDFKLQSVVKNDISNAAAGKAILRDIQVLTLNGLLWMEFSIHPVFNEQGSVIQVVAEGRDVSQRKAAEKRVLHQAHFDTLTGLPNRFLTLDRLSQLLSETQRTNDSVAVLFLDLDDFKKINDTLGHETGDKLLVEAAERLNSVVRDGDTVGRLGGDEFIVLLGGLKSADAARPIAEHLLDRFRNAFKVDGRELMLTISLGIAIYPEDGDNASELLRNADAAMYHSKDLGRNTYSYFTNAMNRDVSRRLALEEQLHGALERGEFTVCYQPQVEISSGKVVGAEALLRWHNPALGDVSPDEFIPITEQNGLIVPIGQFVLTEALTMSAQWHQEYDANFRMSVNISPRQFRDPELVHFIEKAVKQSGVPGEYLELEITEGVLMSAHSYIDDVLNDLNNLGVSIAMDDFGTGYSSLSYLRSYPFDALKIDRSFISDINEDRANRELISAAIAMAHSLNLTVVVEGVERDEQFSYLKELACDYAQGFLLGRPMVAEKMTGLLESLKVGLLGTDHH